MSKLLLTLNLIPSSSFLTNCRSILSKAQWDHVRHQVYAKAWNLCEICGDDSRDAHKIWQFDDKTNIQKLFDMSALCGSCHRVKHFGLAQIQGKGELALKHFMKINKLSKKEAEKHIEKEFEIWEKRSEKTWTLDISVLANYGINLSQIKDHATKSK